MKAKLSLTNLFHVVVFSTVFSLPSTPFLICQVARLETSQAPGVIDSLPFLDLLSTPNGQGEQIPMGELPRAERYNRPTRPRLYDSQHNSVSSYHIGRYQYNGSHKSFPVKDSDLIVVGKITAGIPRLSADGSTVYSVYSFVPAYPSGILKGTPPTPSSVLSVDREGGVVRLPSGRKRFEGIAGQGLPVPGHSYLLFLKSYDSGATYQIVNGYALDTTQPTALDSIDESVRASSSRDLMNRVTEAINAN